MNFFHQFLDSIKGAAESIFSSQGLPLPETSKIVVEPTKDSSHGDIATNAALVLSKNSGMNPRQFAEQLSKHLKKIEDVTEVSVAGPGFVNIKFDNKFWIKQLQLILQQGLSYGQSNLGKGEAFNVEFVSTNPTGPLHAGHGRNAVLGDAIAALLTFVGYNVTREYYINDAGGQVNALARSAYLRYIEVLGETISKEDFSDDMYGGDYLIPAGKALADKFGNEFLNKDESTWLEIFKDSIVDLMMTNIKEDLETAGIAMDVYTSEKALVKQGFVDAALKALEKTGDVYQGVLAPPKGMVIDDWEERAQTLFRATKYGDDTDRPLIKSDGTWTYFASDIAYHYDKYCRGFLNLIDIFGSDHSGYIKRLNAAVSAITESKASFEIKVTQMVNFMDNGTPVRMSKRAGTFITFKDVIERVGKDATRFMMVSRHQDMSLDFDFTKVIEQSKENPIFYIQYAHARIHSVLRHMITCDPEFDIDKNQNAKLELLTDESEIAMIKVLANWPRVIEIAALSREPHRIAHYLYTTAAELHSLWNKGKDNTNLRFIDNNNMDVTKARMALIWAVAHVLKSGLSLLGITAIKEMH